MRILATVALAALAAGCTTSDAATTSAAASPAIGSAEGCAAVTPAMLGATSASGKWVAPANGLPGFCEVTGTLSPVAGSTIGVVYRLPASWNGKVLGIGGGGWAGNTTIQAATPALKRGYATFQTNAGHDSTNVWDTSWAANPEAAKDFAWRGIHEMTVSGKKLVAAFYDRPHSRAYFEGCSTGGRMALMSAQRFPADYDAISSGAPVYTLQVQTSAVLRNQTFAKNNGGFTAEDLALAKSSVLASCDAADGLKDGLIADPRQCNWDPAAIQCSGAKNATCLAPAQVTALRTVYEGVRTPNGEWGMFPMSRGGETGWSLFVGTNGAGTDPSGGGGLRGLLPLIFGNQPIDLTTMTLAQVQTLRGSAFAEMYEAKNPDLSAFFGRGGKLILWHGENDPGPSPVGTNDYVRAVLAKNSAAPQSMRYFTLPGVEHCRGGPGADQVEWLDALDSWKDSGTAPEVLVGTKADGSLTRPHCAWPKVAHYKGSGDANNPASWQCVARAAS
ncbi:tannase/feruloyl esterase family alpha/beta hydrolase [Altererythrobacter sp. Root672]|uniref:tannase/feruloyl esterase family alpha/beta hydrolase n=1 Tax=Altererythrobacter sp. Root672 TaxID=1736584 RepID=UPI0006FFB84F|nr:tannase/feruloyl esterase family alpha/beta hydrolase [Altererythrobacter sp. Root672]KRA83749.1 hypothetical protein ASD76_06950 [Altererythrobacter sp. Root672]